MREHNYYVYIVASRSRVLYIGITNNLERRVSEHRMGEHPGFTSKYRCHRLVWFESYVTVTLAIDREKQLKSWSRIKKGHVNRAGKPDVGRSQFGMAGNSRSLDCVRLGGLRSG